jgi:S-DNA-T family DNA segregation ATPase FtsK/SpoIIIE
MPNVPSHVNIDLEGVETRNDTARHIVAGFATAMPTLADIWRYLEDAFNDVPALAAEITRLSAELQGTRLDRANLLAAARATIAAYHEGESDPLSYLRDELDAHTPPPYGSSEASMTSYRRMRRQARHIRRAGMQPMMVINSGDQVPETVGVLLLRWAWRYRSELAPAYWAAVILGASWWLHATHTRWWPFVLSASVVAAVMLAAFGARLGIPALIERLYAAVATLAAGGWAAAATALGAVAWPLPQALALGGLVLSVPWWAHRRRRARVRVERRLEAWPDIARAVGLAGSQVMSAVVDVWGWRARLRLARGQTIADVTAKIPAIESGLGTFRGAVRVHPTPDDLANRCELRVLDTDPHADAVPWPGPSAASITQPIDLGPFEDAAPCRVVFVRRHAMLGGSTGSGKSGGLNVIMGNLVACPDVVIWAIDLKNGMELKPWESCLDRLATTPERATALLADAVTILHARAELLAATGRRVWGPSPNMPALVIIVDEYAELADDAPDAVKHADSIARLGRAVAVTMIAATQRPTQKVMGQGAVRSQMDIRICFRVRERRDVDLILGQGMLSAGWQAHTLNAPGKFLVSAAEHDTPRRARGYLVSDQAVTDTAARYAESRPQLDEGSRRAVSAASDADPRLADESRPSEPAQTKPHPREEAGSAEDALWLALCMAPNEGSEIRELTRITGMSRPTLYRHLREHSRAGRAVQVSRGRWRASTTEEPSP